MNITLTPEEQQMFNDSKFVNGTKSQMEQYQEECLEGGLAARKFFRAVESSDPSDIEAARTNLIDEVADTLIMSVQMMQILGEDSVKSRIEYKLERQKNRIAKKLLSQNQ